MKSVVSSQTHRDFFPPLLIISIIDRFKRVFSTSRRHHLCSVVRTCTRAVSSDVAEMKVLTNWEEEELKRRGRGDESRAQLVVL